MTNNLKARPFSIVKKILGASLNHLLEEGNYSLQETRGKLGRDVSLCRHTSLAFSAIYTEHFFPYNLVNACTVSLVYFYFLGGKEVLLT